MPKPESTKTLPFGKILKAIAAERNLSVRAIASMAGGRESVAHGWLQSVTPHDLHAVSRLAQALGIGFKALLLGRAEADARPTSFAEMFEENEILDGICKIKISKLTLRKERQD